MGIDQGLTLPQLKQRDSCLAINYGEFAWLPRAKATLFMAAIFPNVFCQLG